MKLLLESQSGGQYRVAANGDLRQTGREAAEPLRTLLGSLAGRQVTLDLGRITSFDASGIAWLVSCHRSLVQSSGDLVLLATPAKLRRALALLGLASNLCPVKAKRPQLATAKKAPT